MKNHMKMVRLSHWILYFISGEAFIEKCIFEKYCFWYKVGGCIRKCNKTKYLALFPHGEKYERMFDRIKYFMLKSNISYVYSHKYMKIKIDSGDDLPLKKTLNMDNLIKYLF